MSGNVNSSTALLTEHLRYTPVSLIDDVINSINTIGYKAVDWVEQGLLGTPLSNLGFSDPSKSKSDQDPAGIEAQVRHEIENGVHQFETLLEATIDKNFDKMEIFALRSIIAIPEDLKDWIRLRHYEGLNLTPSLTPDAPTLETITLQRRKHQETLRLHRLLQAEAARNAALINQLKSLSSSSPKSSSSFQAPSSATEIILNPASQDNAMKDATEHAPPYPAFAFLSHKADLAATTSASTPLSTTTAFALSQLPAMKALLADLRPALTKLSVPESYRGNNNNARRDPNPLREGGHEARREEEEEEEEKKKKNTWRQQRLEYVEAQTRKLHENVRGLELGAHGRVRDGEWQEEGRRVGRGEVEALERVVGLIGGDGHDRDRDRMEEDDDA